MFFQRLITPSNQGSKFQSGRFHLHDPCPAPATVLNCLRLHVFSEFRRSRVAPALLHSDASERDSRIGTFERNVTGDRLVQWRRS
jgi:hypothetical protein